VSESLIKIPLWSHQKEGVRWLYTHRRALLCHGTGSGKTITVLAALALSQARGEPVKALILCDNSSMVSFMSDLQTKTNLTYRQIKNPADCNLSGTVHLLTYSKLKKFLSNILAQEEYTHLILDEAHKVKSGSSQVAKAARDIRGHFQSVWLMTATPLLNDLEDLYFLLSYLCQGIFGSVEDFKKKFCVLEERQVKTWLRCYFTKKPKQVMRTIYEVVGYKNLNELTKVLNEYRHSYYREYDIRFQEHRFRLTQEEERAYIKAAEGLEERLTKDMKEVLHAVRLHDLQLTVDLGVSESKVSSKVQALHCLMDSLKADGGIVFFQYKESLEKAFASCKRRGFEIRRLTGDEDFNERREIVRWLRAGKWVFMTDAGAQSLNLDAVNNFVFFNTPFSCGAFIQAFGRVVRASSVYPYFTAHLLCAENTIDEYKIKLILANASLIREVIGGAQNLPEFELIEKRHVKNMKDKYLWHHKQSVIRALAGHG